MAEVALSLQSVRKSFGTVTAVADVSIDVGSREFFSLLGPSGSGKTTLLRIIAGLEAPDAGRVVVAGRDVTLAPPYQRRIGMVFQDFLLFPHKTVRENIVFPLRMQGVAAEEQRAQLDWVVKLVRLSGLEERYPHQLSGGQKQRVALARGLVSQPAVLLLDEPLANLDRELRKEMEVEVRRFQSELGIPFVYVTHNQEEALTMSDRMAVMHNGVIEQLGPKLELYGSPATDFVASFVGAPNRLEGTVREVADGLATLDWHGHAVHARSHDGLSAGDSAICYVKSERMRLAAPGSGRASNALETRLRGRLRDVIFKGLYADYVVDLEGTELIASGPPRLDEFAAGDDVELCWDAAIADAFRRGSAAA